MRLLSILNSSMQVSSYNFPPLQPRKTNFERLVLDSLERVGLIMSPALLNTRSLAAELAGAVNNFRASGLRPLLHTE